MMEESQVSVLAYNKLLLPEFLNMVIYATNHTHTHARKLLMIYEFHFGRGLLP